MTTITLEEIFLTAEFRILWLTENYPPQRGGMAVSCDRLARSLRELGIFVDVAHFSARYLDWKIEQKINGRQFSCPVREDIPHALNRCWNLIEQEKYTHVAAFGGLLPMMASPIYAAWLKVPLITLIRGNDFDAGIFSLKRGDILREALKKSDFVCAVSRDKVEKISLLYPQTKVSWTPNGINPHDWELSEIDREAAAAWRRANVPDNRRVLGLFGHLKRKKGGLFFLENLVRSGYADKFHLLLVGDAEDEMSQWLELHRQKISFTELPFLDRYELLPLYAACDFIVTPSFYDGMPNVLLEAAALGIPILAASTGGMRDVLKNRETALLFATGDEYSCRQSIEEAAHISEADRRALGVNCLALSQKYNHHEEASKYLQIFSETMGVRSFYAEK